MKKYRIIILLIQAINTINAINPTDMYTTSKSDIRRTMLQNIDLLNQEMAQKEREFAKKEEGIIERETIVLRLESLLANQAIKLNEKDARLEEGIARLEKELTHLQEKAHKLQAASQAFEKLKQEQTEYHKSQLQTLADLFKGIKEMEKIQARRRCLFSAIHISSLVNIEQEHPRAFKILKTFQRKDILKNIECPFS